MKIIVFSPPQAKIISILKGEITMKSIFFHWKSTFGGVEMSKFSACGGRVGSFFFGGGGGGGGEASEAINILEEKSGPINDSGKQLGFGEKSRSQLTLIATVKGGGGN